MVSRWLRVRKTERRTHVEQGDSREVVADLGQQRKDVEHLDGEVGVLEEENLPGDSKLGAGDERDELSQSSRVKVKRSRAELCAAPPLSECLCCDGVLSAKRAKRRGPIG